MNHQKDRTNLKKIIHDVLLAIFGPEKTSSNDHFDQSIWVQQASASNNSAPSEAEKGVHIKTSRRSASSFAHSLGISDIQWTPSLQWSSGRIVEASEDFCLWCVSLRWELPQHSFALTWTSTRIALQISAYRDPVCKCFLHHLFQMWVQAFVQAESRAQCTLFASLAPDGKLMVWDTTAVPVHKKGPLWGLLQSCRGKLEIAINMTGLSSWCFVRYVQKEMQQSVSKGIKWILNLLSDCVLYEIQLRWAELEAYLVGKKRLQTRSWGHC